MPTIFGIDIIYVILIIEALGGIGFILGWFLYNKNKFTAYICEKYLNTFRIIKKMRVSLDKQNFKWKNFIYNIEFIPSIIDNKSKPILFYLVKGARPIFIFDNSKFTVKEDSATFKVTVDGMVMQHLGNRRADRMLTYIIIGLVVAIAIIALFSIYNSSAMNKELIGLAKQIANTTKPTTLPVG